MFSTFVRTIPRTLNWLASLSLGLLLSKVLCLNQIPELFAGAYQLGLVLEGVLGSVIASYIFYVVVVHSKEFKDKASVYPHLIGWVENIPRRCRQQLAALGAAGGVPMSLETLSLQEVQEAFSRISPHGSAPLFIAFNRSATWMDYFEDFRFTTKRDISSVMSQIMFLDAPLVVILTKIADCQHFRIIELFVHQQLRNTDLSAFADDFYEYCRATRELEQYTNDWTRVWLRRK